MFSTNAAMAGTKIIEKGYVFILYTTKKSKKKTQIKSNLKTLLYCLIILNFWLGHT